MLNLGHRQWWHPPPHQNQESSARSTATSGARGVFNLHSGHVAFAFANLQVEGTKDISANDRKIRLSRLYSSQPGSHDIGVYSGCLANADCIEIENLDGTEIRDWSEPTNAQVKR